MGEPQPHHAGPHSAPPQADPQRASAEKAGKFITRIKKQKGLILRVAVAGRGAGGGHPAEDVPRHLAGARRVLAAALPGHPAIVET